ncbi:exonuclease II Exo2 [Coemansia sp. RSA 1807]|nr:exonuclease II Exo2 [Coemansia sp. RSA 1807]
MGIPKFFRWLSGRYPLVCERVSDDNIPEFDNLYLDMNGIIHNCTHPKDGEAPAPATDEERFLAIFYYIDFLFNKIRPRKVFFLGIDGVAPRAKMNEQRARRFRTAKELEEQHEKELRERRANGETIRAEEAETSSAFDPTCITPGTEFMDKLTEALRYYINKRVSEDADWRKPKIILSAPNVPGEGEHKIMDYIRFSRAQPGYRANTRHCLYGLDADLIMLGLLSHEPHFSLLREEVLFGPRARSSSASVDPAMQSFYLLHMSVLRDYLDHEFSGLKTSLGCSPQYLAMEQGRTADADAEVDPNAFDLERIIDDYVLMIMLVGNDFLPNLPKLSINGGALNFMFSTYARIRPALGGYLHDNGKLDLARLQVFMREVARFEVDAFKLDVANHQWYQVYKHKAELRGETLDESVIASDPAANSGRGGRRGRRGGRAPRHESCDDGFGDESAFDLPDGFYSSLGEATIPIKGNRLVLSRSQQDLIDLIRKFAIRALPKAAAAGHKVQLQFLPGAATPLDSLIVAKAAEQLDIHLGREYAYDGSMTLYVAAGSARALAQLELEDGSSGANDLDPFGSSGFFGSAATQHALDSLEDTNDGEESDSANEVEGGRVAVPDFVEKVSDPSNEAAVIAYVDACLEEFSNVLVVPDSELDLYTQRGDASDFWQRFEIWKSGYYKSKVDAAYDIPDVTQDDQGSEVAAGLTPTFRVPAASVEPMCRSYIGTLQWVLKYYYHGCQSWSWYYPFHYAPCISDLCAGLETYNIDNFGSDVPYTPYEQLMSVLPPYSRKLLPPGLRALMVDVHSPIRDMFPTTFSVDMNGKKMPWEAVVLIDFVDIDRIRAAMAPKLESLSEDEQRRNSRGKNMAYSYAPIDVDDDAADAPAYIAPSNLKFPAIRPLKCKGIIYVMPSLTTRDHAGPLQLVRGLVADSACRARMRPGFPSLFTVPHTAYLAFNGTEVFGAPSRDETVMLDVQPRSFDTAASTAEVAQELLAGKHVRGDYRPRRLFVAWPNLKDAVLVGVSDDAGVYTIDAGGSGIIHVPYRDGGERQVWTKLYTDAIYKAKREHGVVLPESRRLLLHVLPLRGLQLYADGSLARDYGFPSGGSANRMHPWADVSAWADLGVSCFPPGLVQGDLSGSWVNNPRFAEHDAIPLEKAFLPASRVFFLGRTPLYGAPGKVIGHARDASGTVVGIDMQLQACVNGAASKHENFLGVNTLARYARAGHGVYRPSYAVARQVGISPLLLSRITSRMLLLDESKTGDAVRIQIGLDLKFEAKRLKVAGYSRRAPNGWQFSDRAIDLITRYRSAFPDMFARLEPACKGDAILTAAECFELPPGADTDVTAKDYIASEVKRLKQWMKANVDRASMALVPIESEILSGDQVAAIAEASAAATPAAKKHVIVRGVRREAALRPADAQYLLTAQSLTVGHRIEYVADRSGSVPLGARGYIVGIHAKEHAQPSRHGNNHRMEKLHQEGIPAEMIQMVEIILDSPFIDGTTLDGRCPPYHGALVRPYQILDLTSWGLGQSVSSRPTADPRAVNTIKPVSGSVQQNNSRASGSTAEVAAKARALMARSAGAYDGTAGVNVPEPLRAPWADHRPVASPGSMATSDKAHASMIMSKLTAGMAGMQVAPTAAAESSGRTHAQNIIGTLLAGPKGTSSATQSTSANATVNNNVSVLHSHPLVAGQYPLVIEEEYFSDSLDEDDSTDAHGRSANLAGASEQPRHNQVFFDYNSLNRGRGQSQSRGQSRGRGGRGGRGGANQAATHDQSTATQEKNEAKGDFFVLKDGD